MLRALAFLVPLALLPLLAQPAAAQDARTLAIRALQDGENVPLTGEQVTVVVNGGKPRDAAQVIHRLPGRLRIDYHSPPGVAGEIAVDDGRTFQLYLPRFGIIEEGESRLAKGDLQRKRLAAAIFRGQGIVEEGPPDVVAGRPTRVLTITPRKGGLPRRIWVDRQNNVPLKIEEVGAKGQTVSTYFTRVDFTAVPKPADFVPNVPAGTQRVPARLGHPIPLPRARQIGQAEWGGLLQPSVLPPGFRFVAAFRTDIQKQPQVVLLYSDGQRAFTLFQGRVAEPVPAAPPRGLTILQRAVGGVALTFVGPLPPDVAQRTLDSVGR